jgi:hypothetical protein
MQPTVITRDAVTSLASFGSSAAAQSVKQRTDARLQILVSCAPQYSQRRVAESSFIQGARQMNMKYRNWLGASGLVLLLAIPLAANADLPGKHPAYLHALTDLRAARWMLEHRPGDAVVSKHEDLAIMEVDKTIGEIKRAAIDDGKDVHDHPSVDVAADRPGRLHKALELLRQVHSDVAREEDDPMTRGLRDRAVGHIDAAIHETEKTIFDVEHGR